MAFANQIDDEDENIEGQPVQAGGTSSIISGQGATATSTAPTPAAAPAGTATGAGGNFVGIQQYINANKPQSAKLANQVGGYVEDLGENARNELSTAQSGYNSAVGSNTVEYNKGLFDEVGQNAAQVAADAAKKAEVEKQRTAQYKGPSSFLESEFYNPAQAAVKAATSASDQTSNEEGQKQMLGQFQQQPRVNQGALAFDSALLSSDPTARARLEAARVANSDLQGSLDRTISEGLTKAQQAAATTAATKASANENLNTQLSDFDTMLKNKVASLTSQSKSQADNLITALRNGTNLTDAQVKSLGISKEQYTNLLADMNLLKNTFGNSKYVDLSPYATKVGVDGQINAQNAASAEDYARYIALNDLMGQQGQLLTDPTKAGGAANIKYADLDVNNLAQNMQTGISAAQQKLDATAHRLWEIGAAGRDPITNNGSWYDVFPSYQAYLSALATAQNAAAAGRAATQQANAVKAANFQAIQNFLNGRT